MNLRARRHLTSETMKHTLKTLALLPLCLASCAAFAAPNAMMLSDCWIRAMPSDLPSGGYFSMTNRGDKPIALTGVQADAFGMAMMHQTQSNGSMSKMVMVDKVTVPANGTVAFAPGNYHVMLEKPKAPVKVGTTLPLIFSFSDGERVTAQCAVKSAATTN